LGGLLGLALLPKRAKRLPPTYDWTSSAPFDALRDIAEDLVADGGMHFERHEDDRIGLAIPMSIETMPVPPHFWR
jgi:hypothetical protein